MVGFLLNETSFERSERRDESPKDDSFFPKLQTFSKSVEPLSRNREPNMTQHEHVYAICCRPEVGDDVIYARNLISFEG